MKKIILFAILLIVILIYILCRNTYNKEYIKLYYISEINLYLQVISSNNLKYGYILLSNDSVMNLSTSIDKIKVNKDVSTIFLINKKNKKEILFVENGNIQIVSKVKYDIQVGINEKDSVYFKQKNRNIYPLAPKEPYLEISISDYLKTVRIKNSQEYYYQEIIKPIK